MKPKPKPRMLYSTPVPRRGLTRPPPPPSTAVGPEEPLAPAATPSLKRGCSETQAVVFVSLAYYLDSSNCHFHSSSLLCRCGSFSIILLHMRVVMRQVGCGIGLSNKLSACNPQGRRPDTVKANEALGFRQDQHKLRDLLTPPAPNRFPSFAAAVSVVVAATALFADSYHNF